MCFVTWRIGNSRAGMCDSQSSYPTSVTTFEKVEETGVRSALDIFRRNLESLPGKFIFLPSTYIQLGCFSALQRTVREAVP